MNHWMQISLAALVAALVGFGSGLYGAAERSARGAEPRDAAELEARIGALAATQQRLAERLDALPSTTPAPAASTGREQPLDLDRAIADYMARRLTASEGGSPGDGGADAEARAYADRILYEGLTRDEVQALWQELRESGRIDAVLAAIEAEAALAPNDPDLQSELGKAYLQKLFDDGMGPMAMIWSEKAENAFDRALELDDHHWSARFNKAVTLGNQPAFVGRQREAIRNFEVLMEQQEASPPAPGHAMTYYFLGNLYEQGGDREKAEATWRRGARLFPDSEALTQKVEPR